MQPKSTPVGVYFDLSLASIANNVMKNSPASTQALAKVLDCVQNSVTLWWQAFFYECMRCFEKKER